MNQKIKEVKCKACGMTLAEANAGKFECEKTNNYEHDFPGFKLQLMIEDVNSYPSIKR